MGSSKDPIDGTFQGLSVRDHRWEYERLRAKGTDPEDSAYTQAGARTGIPEAQQTTDLDLKASGSQSEDGELDFLTRRAGHPAPDGGGFVVRDVDAGDATDEYLGHDGYQVITGWDGSIRYDTSGSGATHRVPVIRLLSGDLLLVESNNGVQHEAWSMDADTGVWSNVATQTLTPGSPASNPDPALVQLPSGRVLYFHADLGKRQVHVRYSDDDGATWDDYATAVLADESADDIAEIAVTYTRGSVSMFVAYGVLPSSGQQWVSHDLGTTFETVGGAWFATSSPQERPAHVNLVGLPSGQVAMLYWWIGSGGAGSETYSFRLIDPNQPGYLSDKTDLYDQAVDVYPYAESSCAMWLDEDGAIYALIELRTTGSVAHTQLLRSTNGGGAWAEQKTVTSLLGSTTTRPLRYSVASTGGRAAWVTRWDTGGPANAQSVGVVYLGGHASATVGTWNDGAAEFGGLSFLGWGSQRTAYSGLTCCWLPFEDPVNNGFTNPGASAGAMVADSKWRLSTSATTDYFSLADSTNDPSTEAVNAAFQLTVNSGGTIAAPAVGIRMRISNYDQPGAVNATWVNEMHIAFTTTQFQVYDTVAGGTVGAAVSFDMTKPTWIFVAMRGAASGNGEAQVWYGRPGGSARRLAVTLSAAQAASFADDSGTNPTDPCRIQWGHISSGTAQSDWEFAGCNFVAGAFQPNLATNFVGAWENPKSLRPRDFPTLPARVLDGVKIQAVDGPTRLGEQWTIKARYDYGIENLHTEINASPRVPWRSTGDGQTELIVWDLEPLFLKNAFMGNYAISFALIGCNFKTAVIKGWNTGGGGSWDTLATLDASAGYGPLKWTRKGSTLQVAAAQTTTGEQYLWRHQHNGDTFDLGATEEPAERYHRVKTNTEGAWRSAGGSATNKRPTVWLEKDNLVGGISEDGTGSIWVRDFMVVLREYQDTYQRFALEIPSQKTVDGYYQIGAFHPGHMLVFSKRHDRGWITTRDFNVTQTTRLDGTRRVRSHGPPRRSLELSWVDTAVDVTQEQVENPDPDYMSSGATGLPVASNGDVLRAVEGLMDGQNGAERPVVFVSQFPQREAGDGSAYDITDRRMFLYGRIPSPSKMENVLGREGISELERLNKIVISEEI